MFAVSFTTACSDDDPEKGDPNVTACPEGSLAAACTVADDDYNKWLMHEPEGATCADGTQYRYFIKHRANSENVLVLYEGGGACWNFETCTAAAGSLGALGVDCVMRNRDKAEADKEHCITENYADTYYPLPSGITGAQLDSFKALIPSWAQVTVDGVAIDTVLPLASAGIATSGKHRDSPVSPMHDWNLVFVPYCTSDLYAGNKVAEYVNPEDPTDVVTFRHVGLQNSEIVAEELNKIFPNVPQFAMNGCSAGGAGVVATYHFFRSAMTGIGKGYVFSDAGPFFPTNPDETRKPAHSMELHTAVREAWGISSVFDKLIADRPDILTEEPEHVSDLYRVLSETYPQDRFSVAHSQTDYNYSLYSYTSFNNMSSRARSAAEAKDIYQFWEDDNSNLIELLEPLPNFSTYMPYWRKTNDSHCISLIGINDAAPSGDELDGLIQIVGNPIEKFYAGTEIFEGEDTYTYRDHVVEVITADDNASIHSREGLEPEGAKMGFRKFCTPGFYNQTGCQCAFGEFENVAVENYGEGTESAAGEAICLCLSADLSVAELNVNACLEP